MPDETFRPGQQHPEPWRDDLNPDAMAGQNRGSVEAGAGPPPRTAYEDKDVHDELNEMTDVALDAISLVPTGTRLKQGATYVDLNGDRREFTAMGDMEAGPNNRYVAKTDVDYVLWNRLIGVKNPERLDLAEER